MQAAARKSDIERTALNKEKTGVSPGAFAMNPLTGEDIPIWVADYVLGAYGTGAIMAVPAHDERDFEFAQKFELPIVQVVSKDGSLARPRRASLQRRRHRRALRPIRRAGHARGEDAT